MSELLNKIIDKVKRKDIVTLTAEQKQKIIEEQKNEIIKRSAVLRRLIEKENTGWSLFCELIEDYKVNQLMMKTMLRAEDDKELATLKRIDVEIDLLDWLMAQPRKYINNTEAMLKREKENERHD